MNRFARLSCLGLLCTIGVTVCAAAAPEADTEGSPRDIQRLITCSRAAYHGHYTDAVALATKVIDHAPQFAAAYVERANLYMEEGRYPEALSDLARALAMHPDTANLFIMRANIELRQRQADRALADLAYVGKIPTASFWKQSYEAGLGDEGGGHGVYEYVTAHTVARMYAFSSIAHELRKEDDAALADLQSAVDNEPLYPQYVLGTHCYVAGLAGLLEMAELTCTQAIEKQTHENGNYDTLGLVHLKMHRWDKAIADYDKALRARPDLTVSLYGRGVAKRTKGDVAGGNADIAAATSGEPDIANIMARLGVKA